jgi:hypothetical protein
MPTLDHSSSQATTFNIGWLDGSMLTQDVFSLVALIPNSMPVLMLSSMQARCRLDRCLDAGAQDRAAEGSHFAALHMGDGSTGASITQAFRRRFACVRTDGNTCFAEVSQTLRVCRTGGYARFADVSRGFTTSQTFRFAGVSRCSQYALPTFHKRFAGVSRAIHTVNMCHVPAVHSSSVIK